MGFITYPPAPVLSATTLFFQVRSYHGRIVAWFISMPSVSIAKASGANTIRVVCASTWRGQLKVPFSSRFVITHNPVTMSRVDRLFVGPTRVLVADFKTNRPAPRRIEEADPAYVLQMALYWAVLKALFPDRKVEAALVWTDGPKLMTIPEELLAASLVRLGQPVDR